MNVFFRNASTVFVLAFVFLTISCEVIWADDNAQTLVVADFNIDDTYDNVQMIQRLGKNENVYLSGTQSGKYILNGGGTGVSYCIPDDIRDFSDYDTFNFWAYNDGYNGVDFDAEKAFYIVFRSDDSMAFLNNIAYAEIKIDWTGWKKFSVNLSEIDTIGTVNMHNITDIQLRPGKLNAVPVTDYWDEIYFDKMWLSVSYDGLVIADMTSKNAVKGYKTLGGQEAFEIDNTVNYVSESSGRWLFPRPAGQVTVFYNNASAPFDVRDYSCVTFNIHSDMDTSATPLPEKIYVYAYPTDGTGAWFQYPITVDWVGWKHFSVPFEQFEFKGTEAGTWSDIKGVRLYAFKENPDVVLHFDNIVFTNEIPDELCLVNTSLYDGEKDVSVDCRKITFTFNNKLGNYLSRESVTILKDGERINDFIFGSYGNDLEIYLNSLDYNSEYTVEANGVIDIYGCSLNGEANITFKTERTQTEKDFVAELNDTLSGTEVMELIKSYEFEDVFFADSNDALQEHTANVIYENIPYKSYEEVEEIAQKAKDLLSELNICDAASLFNFLTKNKEFILNDCPEFEKYKLFSARDINKVNKLIIQEDNFLNFTEFGKKFKNTVSSYSSEGEEVQPKKKLGGGGGGGSKVKVVSPLSVGINKEITKSDLSDEDNKEEFIAFIDLSGFEWAKEAIEELYKREIVSKSEDLRFRPEQNVTRSEFLKMLVAALNMADNNAECSFTDVSKDSWYYIYAASAYKNGIIQGNDRNMFSPEEYIIRQDAALIIYRALKLKVNTFSAEGSNKLTDLENVSDYAKEAVDNIAKAKIINGNQDGAFCPKAFTTRAEAAKIICELTRIAGGV